MEGNPDLAAVVMFTCAHDILEPFIKEQYFICMMTKSDSAWFIALHNERLWYACAVHHYDELVWILWKCIALCCRENICSALLFCFQTHIIQTISSAYSSFTEYVCLSANACSIGWYHDIYIYAFSRCFYPKRLTVHSGYIFVWVFWRVFNIWWSISNCNFTLCVFKQYTAVVHITCIYSPRFVL